MTLIEINSADFGIDIQLVYATEQNFTDVPVYKNAICYLHLDAVTALADARDCASDLDLKLLIFDAFRPKEAQQVLWDHTPDENFLAHPRRGSPHSRGIAVDLTLADKNGQPLDMGTGFDTFSTLSHHGARTISSEARRNRLLLLGIMTEAGWNFYRNEWWHYQLFNSSDYPLLGDNDLPKSMMKKK